MTERLDTVMFPVDDLARAMAVYAPHGVQPSTEEPYHRRRRPPCRRRSQRSYRRHDRPLRHWYVDES
jgi:hypothetical protein